MTPVRPITGETRLFAMLGDPIRQVRSPANFNRIAAAGEIDAVMVPMHVPADHFDEVAGSLLRVPNLDGIVLTVPFKERAIKLSDNLLPNAMRVGAINAMRRSPGGWTGEIFDGIGFIGALRQADTDPTGASVFIQGAGGAARAIAVALADAGASRITVVDINAKRAQQLVHAIGPQVPGCRLEIADDARAANHTILVNATPVGLQPEDPCPFRGGPLSQFRTVIDIVPSKVPTRLLQEAAAAGCVVVGGQAMIDQQAAAIAEFLLGAHQD